MKFHFGSSEIASKYHSKISEFSGMHSNLRTALQKLFEISAENHNTLPEISQFFVIFRLNNS